MTPRLLRLVSHVPGRLRVRALAFRAGDGERTEERAELPLVEELRALPGVARVDRTPLTGSLLVHYDPALVGLDALLAFLVERGDFEGLEAEVPSAGPQALTAERVLGAAGRLNRATLGLPFPLDMRVVVPGALASVGAVMLATRRRRVPEWYDFFWWSFSAFVALKGNRAADDGRGEVPR